MARDLTAIWARRGTLTVVTCLISLVAFGGLLRSSPALGRMGDKDQSGHRDLSLTIQALPTVSAEQLLEPAAAGRPVDLNNVTVEEELDLRPVGTLAGLL